MSDTQQDLREAAQAILPHLEAYLKAEGCLNPDVDCMEEFDNPDDRCANHKLECKYQSLVAALAAGAGTTKGAARYDLRISSVARMAA